MEMRKAPNPTPSPADFDEVRIPFDVVMRKLVQTKPRKAAPVQKPAKP